MPTDRIFPNVPFIDEMVLIVLLFPCRHLKQERANHISSLPRLKSKDALNAFYP